MALIQQIILMGLVSTGVDAHWLDPPLENHGFNGCIPGSECGVCQGDCDTDNDCRAGLKCFQRSTSAEVVPGCAAGGSGDISDFDYCYEVVVETTAKSTTTSSTTTG